MLTLALDVDGVLLDVDRGGAGHWSNELFRRHGIDRSQLRDTFFAPAWEEIVTGVRSIEPALERALAELDSDVSVNEVLDCWFEADFVVIESTVAFARRASEAGVRVVLATNQEHRRARFLVERLAPLMTVDEVLYSAALGHPKPHADFFESASERLGVGPGERSEVVFVDDGLANVEAARRSGWRAVHADADRGWHDAMADLLGLPSVGG